MKKRTNSKGVHTLVQQSQRLQPADTRHLSVPSLPAARQTRKGSVIDVCEACVCPSMVFSGMRVYVCMCVCVFAWPLDTHTHTPLASLRPFSPLALAKLNNADGVSVGQVATCVKQQLPGALP